MTKPLPYWRVDDNLISIDFPQHAPRTDFAAIEAEISLALWNNDAGTVGLNPFCPVKDPA